MFLITSTATCKYCLLAKTLLDSHGYSFEENMLDSPEKLAAFKATGHTTVPQIWYQPYDGDPVYVGGYDKLADFLSINKDKL